MDSNPYAFNRDVSYPTCAGFPQNVDHKDILEAHIQVVIPEKVSDGWGDFTAEVEDIFSKYQPPHISSDTVIGLWQTRPMGFCQNQVHFAVWCSTTGCGVSWRDHLDIDRPVARSVFRFHRYYQIRRILNKLQAPLPQDQAWALFQNPYDRRAHERLYLEFGVDLYSDWRVSGPNRGLGRVYNYWTNDGYHPVGNGEYDSSRMSFTRQTSNHYIHVDFIKQDAPNADTAWGAFVLDKSEGFTSTGVERLNDSIRTYAWAILGARAQTRSDILGSGTSSDAQKQFLANVEDAISSPVDIPSAIEWYQSVLQNASSKVDYTFTWPLATCASMWVRFRVATTPSSLRLSGSFLESLPTITALQCQPLLRLEKPGWWWLQWKHPNYGFTGSSQQSSWADTRSARSQGRKKGPCRCWNCVRTSVALAYEALRILGQPGRAGQRRPLSEPTDAWQDIRWPSPKCWGARTQCSQWSPAGSQPPCQPVWPGHGQEVEAFFLPTIEDPPCPMGVAVGSQRFNLMQHQSGPELGSR